MYILHNNYCSRTLFNTIYGKCRKYLLYRYKSQYNYCCKIDNEPHDTLYTAGT